MPPYDRHPDLILAEWSQRGQEIARLQREVHRLRERNKRLRGFRDKQRQIQLQSEEAVRQVLIAREQIKKLIEAGRKGSTHGIHLEPGEDRLEAMALIVQQVRTRNMEQHLALTRLATVAEHLSDHMREAEDEEFDDYITPGRQTLLDALSSAQSVLNGSKSLETQARERAALKQREFAEEVRLFAVSSILTLETRVGPVRKRDLEAIRQRLTQLSHEV